MDTRVKICNSNNHEFEANIVLCFEVPEIDEKYIVYTLPSNNDLSVISVGKLKTYDEDTYTIEELENDDEWTFIKKVMFQIIEDGR